MKVYSIPTGTNILQENWRILMFLHGIMEEERWYTMVPELFRQDR